MRSTPIHRPTRPLAALVAAATLALAATVGEASSSPTLKISTAQNAQLGKRILATRSGRSLYTLSAETRGRFICDDANCLASWPPLLLRRGVQPTGVRFLGAIRRPDGRRQATYRGRPLYRFSGDYGTGDVAGEGFRDVGTWHVAVAPGR